MYFNSSFNFINKNFSFWLISFKLLVTPISNVFSKSKSFEKKVLYFGGCGSKLKGDRSIVKILNSINIEVINPEFHCCGIPYFSRGDLNEYNNSDNEGEIFFQMINLSPYDIRLHKGDIIG